MKNLQSQILNLKSQISNLKSQISNLKYSFLLSPFYLFLAASAAKAQETVDIGSKVTGFFGYKCVLQLVYNIVDTAIIISGIALLVFLVWGGVEWIISGGEKTKIQNAQSRLTNALMGVAFVAASFAIWKLALYFFGIDINQVCNPNPLGPPLMNLNPII